MTQQLRELRLKRSEERRLRTGHLWVYSNEVDTQATPLGGFTPGELVRIRSARGAAMGVAYINPNTLICARLLARDEAQPLPALIAARLRTALSLRERLYRRPFYRLVNGEGDALPGLIVDRYDDTLVLQLGTAGMDRLRPVIVESLQAMLPRSSLVLRNDAPVRELEGLPLHAGIECGEPGEHLVIEEGGVRFEVPLLGGQKTGWYYDQRDNRTLALPFAQDARVLDAYTYAGAWAVRCARAGARAVTAIDSSAPALELAHANAALNACAERIEFMHADAAPKLRELYAAGERFDLVVLDPPPLIKRRRDLRAGESHYLKINERGLRLLAREGVLVSCSCSHHMSADNLRRTVVQAARRCGRALQLLATGTQALDHPQHPAMPETAYLKALFFRVLE